MKEAGEFSCTLNFKEEPKTCKDCQAFVADQEVTEDLMPGVCILNPPQMLVGTETAVDGSDEQVVMSAFPKVDGVFTRCMKLIPIIAILLCCSCCAPQEKLGGRSILGTAWSNFVNNRRGTPEYYRTHYVCRTSKDGYGYYTECR